MPEPTLADQPKVEEETLNEDISDLKTAAEIIHPGIGRQLYEWWDELNREHFGRQMVPCGIQFGLTPHGASLGQYHPGTNVIILHRSLVEPSGNAWGIAHKLGEKFCRDVLLHEMVHQYIRTVRGITGEEEKREGTSSHNNPWWVAEIKRISPQIGLDIKATVITQRRIEGEVTWHVPDGHLTMDQLGSWPHCVTRDEWYKGEADSRQ